ncbi:unnamed protein product [Diamesa serratosioi]
MASKLTLYFAPGSPPARACLMLVRKMKLDVNVKMVDLGALEHHSKEYKKLNPLKKVPVLVDNDFVLTESRAILAYLVNSRQPGSSLYPTEPQARARIDQRLYFDATVVFDCVSKIVFPVLYRKTDSVSQESRDKFAQCFKVLDSYLVDSKWFAGDNLTIADYSILGTITTADEFGYDLTQHKHLNEWFQKCKTLPGFEENRLGGKFLADMVASKCNSCSLKLCYLSLRRMSSRLTFYHAIGSPPSRACLMLIRTMELDVNLKILNLSTGEQNSEEFLKINPLHNVPVLVDDEFVLTESRAILAYLVNSRKPGSSLYPTEPKARALVDMRLYYDATVVFESVAQIIRDVLYTGMKKIPDQQREKLVATLQNLDGYLEKNKWIAGEAMTIADLSILGTITTVKEFGYNLNKHKNLDAWYQKCKTLPGFNENKDGAVYLAGRILSVLEDSF